MKIDKVLLDKLTEQAKASPRLRMNYDLRNSHKDTSQRMLNAIEPGSMVPIHRHQNSSETIVCLRGSFIGEFYNDLNELIESVILIANSDCVAINIPIGVWHTLKSIESGSIIIEMKDGAYEPITECDILSI